VIRSRATLACAALIAVAGCGGGDDPEHEPIPGDLAAEMETQLDLAKERFDDGICGSAGRQVRELQEKAARIPRNTDPAVRREIRRALERLAQLVESDCERPEDEEEDTDTETVETETIPTVTEEAPAPSPPEPEEPPPPPQTNTQPQTPDTTTEEPPDDGGTQPGNGGTPPGQQRKAQP
jgi:hypothetical protein